MPFADISFLEVVNCITQNCPMYYFATVKWLFDISVNNLNNRIVIL